jgi:hypothetical protein
MRLGMIVGAALLLAGPAWADNPHDPSMQRAEARARDRAMTRELNRREIAYVKHRDSAEASRGASNAAALADYARSRAQYERDLAAWRRAVGQ